MCIHKMYAHESSSLVKRALPVEWMQLITQTHSHIIIIGCNVRIVFFFMLCLFFSSSSSIISLLYYKKKTIIIYYICDGFDVIKYWILLATTEQWICFERHSTCGFSRAYIYASCSFTHYVGITYDRRDEKHSLALALFIV